MVSAHTQTPLSRKSALPTPVTVPARRKSSEAALGTSAEPLRKHPRLSSDVTIQDMKIKREPDADVALGGAKENVNPSASLQKKSGQTLGGGSNFSSSTLVTKKRAAAVSVHDDVFSSRPSTSSATTKYSKPTGETFVATPAPASSSRQVGEKSKQLPMEAYAKYKGRGRYAAHEEKDGDPK